MELNKKQYETPTIQVVELTVGGIVCGSELEGLGNGFSWN